MPCARQRARSSAGQRSPHACAASLAPAPLLGACSSSLRDSGCDSARRPSCPWLSCDSQALDDFRDDGSGAPDAIQGVTSGSDAMADADDAGARADEPEPEPEKGFDPVGDMKELPESPVEKMQDLFQKPLTMSRDLLDLVFAALQPEPADDPVGARRAAVRRAAAPALRARRGTASPPLRLWRWIRLRSTRPRAASRRRPRPKTAGPRSPRPRRFTAAARSASSPSRATATMAAARPVGLASRTTASPPRAPRSRWTGRATPSWSTRSSSSRTSSPWPTGTSSRRRCGARQPWHRGPSPWRSVRASRSAVPGACGGRP